MVFLVTRVQRGTALGIQFTIMGTDSGPILEAQAGVLVSKGAGLFYLDPRLVRDLNNLPHDPNVQILTGPGQVGISIQQGNDLTRYSLTYDQSNGKVREIYAVATMAGKNGPQRVAAHLAFVSANYQNWPRVRNFPAAANVAARYALIIKLGGIYGGATQTNGYLTVGPTMKYGALRGYSLSGNQGQKEEYGVPSYGPGYVNPALLGKGVLASAPRLGFMFTSQSPNDLAAVVGGQTLIAIRVDPSSGRIMQFTQSYPGIGWAIYQLISQ